jgi:hypothetical protein
MKFFRKLLDDVDIFKKKQKSTYLSIYQFKKILQIIISYRFMMFLFLNAGANFYCKILESSYSYYCNFRNKIMHNKL